MKYLMLKKDNPLAVFHLFGEKHKDLYHLIRSQIRGGLSMVWTRYHEAGVTNIRERELDSASQMCQSAHGFDVSGMPNKENFKKKTFCQIHNYHWYTN